MPESVGLEKPVLTVAARRESYSVPVDMSMRVYSEPVFVLIHLFVSAIGQVKMKG